MKREREREKKGREKGDRGDMSEAYSCVFRLVEKEKERKRYETNPALSSNPNLNLTLTLFLPVEVTLTQPYELRAKTLTLPCA
eukprot:381328-Amorphochlora_amoeboformis.AAC.1